MTAVAAEPPSPVRALGRVLAPLARGRRTIGAVARNTIRQALRVRVAFVILAVYLALMPLLPFVLEGDGTLRGLLHVVITYSLIVAGVLLGLLTLALSTTTLWSEIHEKQIYLLESYPVRRWHILLGKLVGILVFNAALLVFMGIVTVGCVEYLAHQTRWSAHEKALARRQVLTARRAIGPEPPSEEWLEAETTKLYAERKEAGELPRGVSESEFRKEVRNALLALQNAVPPRAARIWRFRGVPRLRGERAQLTIRFKYSSSNLASDSPVRTRWLFVNRQESRYAGPYDYNRKPDEFHEIQAPAGIVGDDGTLEVHFFNFEGAQRPLPTLIFAGDEAIQVLIPVSGFLMNLARGLLLIFVEILFLAVLGLFCSTFLSFPVSPIVALSFLFIIYLSGTVKAEFDKGMSLVDRNQPTTTARVKEKVIKAATSVLRVILPPLDRYGASSRVSAGQEVPWPLILESVTLVGLLRGGLILLLGAVIFEHRELALAAR